MRAGSARLALILGGLADDESVGPPARRVLAEAAEAQPGYVDVRAALIRREFADGLVSSAKLRLEHWERSQPGHPEIERLHGEVAA